jgi:hypothetical protein
MKSLKDLVLDHCRDCGEHAINVGKIHKEMHGIHKALADGEGDPKEHHAALADCHKTLVTHHADHAAQWATFGKALEESPDVIPKPGHEGNRGHGGDLDGPGKVLSARERFTRAVDDGVVGVHGAPERTDRPTLVPRFGGPTEADAADAVAKVPEGLRHLVKRES